MSGLSVSDIVSELTWYDGFYKKAAVEAAIDRIGPELHPLSKKAKDLGSLAVLLTIFADACIWIGVLLDYFLS